VEHNGVYLLHVWGESIAGDGEPMEKKGGKKKVKKSLLRMKQSECELIDFCHVCLLFALPTIYIHLLLRTWT
jgi:hypothetical protein